MEVERDPIGNSFGATGLRELLVAEIPTTAESGSRGCDNGVSTGLMEEKRQPFR